MNRGSENTAPRCGGHLAHQVVDLHLADEVARAVGGLLQVELLLAPHGGTVDAQPPTRRVVDGEA